MKSILPGETINASVIQNVEALKTEGRYYNTRFKI